MVVLDSSFIVAYHNERDLHHAAARPAMDRLRAGEWGAALLPEYVFLEVVTVLAARRDLPTAVRIGDLLLAAREVELVPCSDIFLEAYEVFREQPSFRMSLADAAILAIARRRNASAVLTFDEDFRTFPDLRVLPD